ncbi:MAG: hypothetical protein IJM76_02725 [Lachnospiraceae bacterium]|nr:hypothetical protein [Lachnospiraceae bacterium]
MLFFIIAPFIIFILEIAFTFKETFGAPRRRGLLILDLIGYVTAFGGIYLLIGSNIDQSADWFVQLRGTTAHAFFANEHKLTVIVLSLFGVICWLLLSLADLKKLAPLVKVIALSGTYLWTVFCCVCLFHLLRIPVFTGDSQIITDSFISFLLPWLVMAAVCVMLIAARITYHVVKSESEEAEKREEVSASSEENPAVGTKFPRLRRWVSNSAHWPLLAMLLLFPIVGLFSMILMLFGQSPAAAIKAFTETADWSLSTKTAPPSLFYDEHYLCTVAAGGHRKIVKPLRKGIRHGHPVIVNRQLKIANAFEQVLEERTPRFNKVVRGFYDKYGFPLASLIRTKLAADVVYLLMKPLEWVFLMVLYLTDVHPEDRIAIQYTGKRKEDFL